MSSEKKRTSRGSAVLSSSNNNNKPTPEPWIRSLRRRVEKVNSTDLIDFLNEESDLFNHSNNDLSVRLQKNALEGMQGIIKKSKAISSCLADGFDDNNEMNENEKSNILTNITEFPGLFYPEEFSHSEKTRLQSLFECLVLEYDNSRNHNMLFLGTTTPAVGPQTPGRLTRSRRSDVSSSLQQQQQQQNLLPEESMIRSTYYLLFGALLTLSRIDWDEQKTNCKATIRKMIRNFQDINDAADCKNKFDSYGLQHAVRTTKFDDDGNKLLEPAADGGFSMVYKMIDKESGVSYAWKLLDMEHEKDVEELKEEAKIQEIVSNHRGFVKLESYSICKNYGWILSEWIGGGTLEDYSKKFNINNDNAHATSTSNFDVNDVASKFLAAIIPSFMHLFLKRIQHGDIKPDNIMLRDGDPNQPVLTDFGESQQQQQIVVDNYDNNDGGNYIPCSTIRGTPHYQCPEMDGTQEYCPYLADIYSLGYVVLALVVGVERYENHVEQHKYSNESKEMVLEWANQETNVSPALLELLKRMTNVNPLNRPYQLDIHNHSCVEEAREKLIIVTSTTTTSGGGGGDNNNNISIFHSHILQHDINIMYKEEIRKLKSENMELKEDNKRYKKEQKIIKNPSSTTIGEDDEEEEEEKSKSFLEQQIGSSISSVTSSAAEYEYE